MDSVNVPLAAGLREREAVRFWPAVWEIRHGGPSALFLVSCRFFWGSTAGLYSRALRPMSRLLLLLLKRTSSENSCLVLGLRMFSMNTIP